MNAIFFMFGEHIYLFLLFLNSHSKNIKVYIFKMTLLQALNTCCIAAPVLIWKAKEKHTLCV
jgi:hypothetical protein